MVPCPKLITLLVFSLGLNLGDLWADERILPPPLPETEMSGPKQLIVNEYDFVGNTVISDDELRGLLDDFRGRELTVMDLIQIKNRVTQHYIDNGYITSGALIPDQDGRDGKLKIVIVEGQLTEIKLTGNQRLKDRYIKSRIVHGCENPIAIQPLQHALQMLQQNPRIERINSTLQPGIKPGESELLVAVNEAFPILLDMGFSNHRSPSIGSYRGEINLASQNLTGWGDTLGGSYGLTEGLDDYQLFYSLPVTSQDTTLTVSYDANDSSVITPDFERLDIENQTERYRMQLRHPFYKTTTREFALSLALVREKSETSLLGEPFSFSPGVDDGDSRVTIVEFGQEWIDRSMTRVYALRSALNVGIDWLDATVNQSTPDGEFISFTLQCQSIHRLNFIKSEIHTHFYMQLADDDVLPLKKTAIGGRDTVRGYRENELTRDNGISAGIEYQWPMGRINIPGVGRMVTDGQIKFAVFGDYGYGWNHGGVQPDPPDLASIGWGVLWYPRLGWELEFYWGYALRRITGDDEHDLQDDGIHFEIKAKLF